DEQAVSKRMRGNIRKYFRDICFFKLKSNTGSRLKARGVRLGWLGHYVHLAFYDSLFSANIAKISDRNNCRPFKLKVVIGFRL
ncbi:MAG: hypothetical protein K2K58_01350, partial [Muribaculaceae bacterium]|nr:hypothetical protein [Muribaculaceae bacterium]